MWGGVGSEWWLPGAVGPFTLSLLGCVLAQFPPAGNQQAGSPGQRGGEMSRTKCKFMLTSGAENMFSATRGTLIFHKVK